MSVLREIKGQYQGIRSGVLNFHATIRKCGLGDKADLRINLSQNHVLMIFYLELSNPATSTICMKQSRTIRTEGGLTSGVQTEAKNRAFLITQKFTVDNPFCIHSISCKFIGGNCRRAFLRTKSGS